jgi:hypothetical protein
LLNIQCAGQLTVELLKYTTVGGAFWPILLAAALVLLGVWLGKRSRVDNTRTDRATAASVNDQFKSTSLVYADAPTIVASNSKRVDRLHRTLTLSVGEQIDLLDLTFDRIPRLRLSLNGFDGDYARIAIELGGAIAGCGSLVKELAPNQFLVPRAVQEEQRASILHFHGKDDTVNFLRVKVIQLHLEDHTVDVDVLHVCGQWNV